MVEARMSEWKEKPLHGQYLRETEDVKSTDTWLWLREGTLKKEREFINSRPRTSTANEYHQDKNR